jgi:hypothetical protein
MYHGGFERNRPQLKPGATTFLGSDGAEHALAPWPSGVDGLRFGYMEKPGKRFVVVRLVDDKEDMVLENDVLLDFARHLGHGKRLSPEATVITDETAAVLLADIMAKNPRQQMQLANFRVRLRKPPSDASSAGERTR